MNIIDAFLKTSKGKWSPERIWTNSALLAFHVMAFSIRDKITIMEWAQSYAILHTLLFLGNGAKNLMDKKADAIS